jgi:hypothetical protein
MKEVELTWQQVVNNCEDFADNVGTGDYYEWASWVIDRAWGAGRKTEVDIRGVVSGIMILEYSWNDMFYENGLFQRAELEKCIEKHRGIINRFRRRDLKLTKRDEKVVQLIFKDFLEGLKNCSSGLRSPVAVAKCLHLLAPRFFPLWDNAIAKGTGYHWGSPVNPETAAKCYTDFMKHIQKMLMQVEGDFMQQSGLLPTIVRDAMVKEYEGQTYPGKTMLKLMDEYLYVEYTRPKWKRR